MKTMNEYVEEEVNVCNLEINDCISCSRRNFGFSEKYSECGNINQCPYKESKWLIIERVEESIHRKHRFIVHDQWPCTKEEVDKQ